MTRDDLLLKLKSLKLRSQLVAMPTEGGLDFQFATAQGYGGCWLGYHEWPAYCLKSITQEALDQVKTLLQFDLFDVDSIENDGIRDAFQEILGYLDEYDIDYRELFEDLLNIKGFLGGDIYAYFDFEEPSVRFYVSYQEFEEDFIAQKCEINAAWDSLDDAELADWVDNIDTYDEGVPFINMDNQ